MIVIGYQGIGKTSLCSKHENYIDLESGLMKDPMNENKRWDNWAEIYCNIALSLSGQGYTVFVSSHKAVQDKLKDSLDSVIAIFPSKKIKNEWIDKLQNRWQETSLKKDEIAWLDAKEHFDDEIDILSQTPFVRCEIGIISYDLDEIVTNGRGFLDF